MPRVKERTEPAGLDLGDEVDPLDSAIDLSHNNKDGNRMSLIQNNRTNCPWDLEFRTRFTGRVWEEAAQAKVTQVANVT